MRALSLPNPGRRGRGQQLLAGRRVGPDRLGAAVVVLDDVAAEVVGALRHRPGIAVERGLVAEDGLEDGRVHRRDRGRVELGRRPAAASAAAAPERPLHRDLLVEEHPEQHRERLPREQLVGLRDRP